MFELIKMIMEDFEDTESSKFGADGKHMKKDQSLDPTVYDVDTILNKLDGADEEVETITFGLENDEGDIIKVYVNKDDADGFEEALAAKLGEEDNIEVLLSDLSKDFDIVDVEWPEDDEDIDDALKAAEKTGVEADALVNDEISSGDESMNGNIKDESYGEKVKSRLFAKFNEHLEEAKADKYKAAAEYIEAHLEKTLNNLAGIKYKITPEKVIEIWTLAGTPSDSKREIRVAIKNGLADKSIDSSIFDVRGNDINIISHGNEHLIEITCKKPLKEADEQTTDDIEIEMDPEAKDLMSKYKNEYVQFGFEILMKLGVTTKMIETIISRNPTFPRDLLAHVRDLGSSKRNVLKRTFSIEE